MTQGAKPTHLVPVGHLVIWPPEQKVLRGWGQGGRLKLGVGGANSTGSVGRSAPTRCRPGRGQVAAGRGGNITPCAARATHEMLWHAYSPPGQPPKVCVAGLVETEG